MWLSQQLSRGGERSAGGISTGRVTISGDTASVMLEGERRELPLACPGGMIWSPAVGDEVLVLRSDEGERFVMGHTGDGATKAAPGELILRSGANSLRIGKNGIELEGTLNINGRLVLNGLDVGAFIARLGG